MNQLIAIACAGAVGSILRFLVSNGVYFWLGRDFPYGTLAVNVIGCLLMGLMVEALVLQRVVMALEFRAAILVGLFGAFTTFSTFSLETVYLLEQGNFAKAALNVLLSVSACLLAVWLGLLLGRTLFLYSGGVIRWMGVVFPYALLIINSIGAFIIGFISVVLINKMLPTLEQRAVLIVLLAGIFVTLSSLYLVLYLIEDGYTFDTNLHLMLTVFVANTLLCMSVVWIGVLAGERL